MVGTAITLSLLIGWLLGFVSYYAVRVGYKALIEVLEEEKMQKKESLAYTGKVD